MSVVIRALFVLVLASAHASADGATRVLLADADPELQRAVRATLAPWRVEVIVETHAPADAAHAQMISDEKTARFVVWREHGDLVVFDRERGDAERRAASAGPLDAASAAAAALTVKTLMRLPPPEQVATAPAPEAALEVAQPAVRTQRAPSTELRVQGAFATRAARGDENVYGGRAHLAVFLKPPALPLRFGVAGDFGLASDVDHAGFKGTWRDWSVIGLASVAFAMAPRWDIEPYVGAGVLRSSVDGDLGSMARHERATLATFRSGAFVRVRTRSALSIGGALGIEATTGTPTYTRGPLGSNYFEVPPFALTLGLFVAVDLTR